MQDFLITSVEKLIQGKDLYNAYNGILNYFAVNNLYERSEIIVAKSSSMMSEYSEEKGDLLTTVKEMATRYIIIVYIFLYLLQKARINEMLRLISGLEQFEADLKSNARNIDVDKLNFLNELVMVKQMVSAELAQHTNNFDLNMLAIKFCKANTVPYVNIIMYLLERNKSEEAMTFYNEKFVPAIGTVTCSSVVALYWLLSDLLGNLNRIYESVLCQQKAIDLALELRGKV